MKIKEPNTNERKKLKKASRNLKRMEEKIAPFRKESKQIIVTTAGEWQENATWISRLAGQKQE